MCRALRRLDQQKVLSKQKEDRAKNLELSLEMVHVTKNVAIKMRLLSFSVHG